MFDLNERKEQETQLFTEEQFAICDEREIEVQPIEGLTASFGFSPYNGGFLRLVGKELEGGGLTMMLDAEQVNPTIEIFVDALRYRRAKGPQEVK